jgi:creatinine amidohydrolase
VESLLDCGRSLCRHGFDRILLLNGHGSNAPLVDIAARLINVEGRGGVSMDSPLYLTTRETADLLSRERDSEPGGMSHACELETSLYLALDAELVQMDKAVREIPTWTDNVFSDWPDAGPLSYMPHWSGLTESGVMGDATVATAGKGHLFLERAQEEAADFIAETAYRRRDPGADRHAGKMEPQRAAHR